MAETLDEYPAGFSNGYVPDDNNRFFGGIGQLAGAEIICVWTTSTTPGLD